MRNANTSNIYLHSKTPVSKRFVRASRQLLTRTNRTQSRRGATATPLKRAGRTGGVKRTRTPLSAVATPRSHSASALPYGLHRPEHASSTNPPGAERGPPRPAPPRTPATSAAVLRGRRVGAAAVLRRCSWGAAPSGFVASIS